MTLIDDENQQWPANDTELTLVDRLQSPHVWRSREEPTCRNLVLPTMI